MGYFKRYRLEILQWSVEGQKKEFILKQIKELDKYALFDHVSMAKVNNELLEAMGDMGITPEDWGGSRYPPKNWMVKNAGVLIDRYKALVKFKAIENALKAKHRKVLRVAFKLTAI